MSRKITGDDRGMADRVRDAALSLLDDRFAHSKINQPPVLLDFEGTMDVLITEQPDIPDKWVYEARAALGDDFEAEETHSLTCYGAVVMRDREETFVLHEIDIKGLVSGHFYDRRVNFERLDEIEQHPDVTRHELTEFTEDQR